jgi:hypothetical protein
MTNQTRSAPAATDTTISIEDLRTVFDDRLISPTDAAYDEARTVFYGGIDRRPAVIVRARSRLRATVRWSSRFAAAATASPATACPTAASCSTSRA